MAAVSSFGDEAAKHSIRQAIARQADGRAALENRDVVVTGVATVDSATLDSEQYRLYIQDDTGGIALFNKTRHTDLPAVRVGDFVEAEGPIATYAGMIEVAVKRVRVLARGVTPEPIPATVNDLRSHKFYGRLVRLNAPVLGVRPISTGLIVALGTPQQSIDLYLTKRQLLTIRRDFFQPGSVISVVGVASQYDRKPPFKEGWQILPRTAADLALVKSPPRFRMKEVALAGSAVISLALIVFFWNVSLRRRVARQTRVHKEQAESLRIELDERHRAEAAREESELKYRTLVESLTAGLAQSDEQDIIVLVNNRLCEITGFEREELIGEPLAMLTERVKNELFTRRDGGTFPMEIISAPMIDKGQVRGRVTSFSDVSERVLLQRQVEQDNRVKSLGHLAATVAHEFNNVLMGIQPFAELTRRHNPDDERIQKATAYILQSVERGKRISLEILRYTRPVEPALRPIPAGGWLAEIAEDLRTLLGSSIQFSIEDRSDQALMMADPAQLSPVFTNLVLNARDAMPNGGALTITVDKPARGASFSFGVVPGAERFIHFAVRDTGAGIPPEFIGRLFEPLFTTKKGGRTGLGLAVVHQIVSQHGGSIFVESEPGQGTTFHLMIPVAVSQRSYDKAGKKASRSAIERVLLIDDDHVVADGIEALLEAAGIAVRTIGRGELAASAIEQFRPDALVLDIGLPDIDGVELYRQLSRRWPNLPVIFSTGHGDEQKLQELLHRDHVAFLLKPYRAESLLSHLAAISLVPGGVES
jgi:signal transduction histidine kinase/CheY-like chemotaxis protein/DNA/RNA endonuclease YhcR with UshA esterase domain